MKNCILCWIESKQSVLGDVVMLPEEEKDKYELFKKWLDESDYYFQNDKMSGCFSMNTVFEKFEHDCNEKEREEKVKQIIRKNISSATSFSDAEKVYVELKKEDLLK